MKRKILVVLMSLGLLPACARGGYEATFIFDCPPEYEISFKGSSLKNSLIVDTSFKEGDAIKSGSYISIKDKGDGWYSEEDYIEYEDAPPKKHASKSLLLSKTDRLFFTIKKGTTEYTASLDWIQDIRGLPEFIFNEEYKASFFYSGPNSYLLNKSNKNVVRVLFNNILIG